MEAREDFTEADGMLWPMQVVKGGETYGFCPGKAQWDGAVARMYQTLVISAETGTMYETGPLAEQPSWWVNLLAWFIPVYDDRKFWSRQQILGGMYGGNN